MEHADARRVLFATLIAVLFALCLGASLAWADEDPPVDDSDPVTNDGIATMATGEPLAEVVEADGSVSGQYKSLSLAFSNGEGKTVRLLQDVPLQGQSASALYDIGKSLTFDLNGHTINGTRYYTVGVNKYQSKIDVIIKNGTIKNAYDLSGTSASFGTAVFAKQGGNLTLENVTLESSPTAPDLAGYGLTVGQSGTAQQPCVIVDGSSTSISGDTAGIVLFSDPRDTSTLVVNDGTITGGDYGIVGNGENDNTSITINGGLVQAMGSGNAKGIYHPQDGDLTIANGTVSGPGAVQYSGAGNLVISGGELHGTGSDVADPDTSATSAPIEDGAALSILSRGGGYGADSGAAVEITGGTFISDNSTALLEGGADGCASLIGSLSIGGDNLSFYAGNGEAVKFNLLQGDAAKVISGGLFSSKVPAEYCAAGYVPTDLLENNRYSVTMPPVQIRTDYSGTIFGSYPTIDEALAAIEGVFGSTKIIAIVGDCTITSDLRIPDGVSLDVQKGGSLTVSSGSTLTVSDGCKRLGVYAGGALNIESGGKVFIEGGVANKSGYVLLQPESTLNGELSIPDGYFLDRNSNSYAASKISDAVAKLQRADNSEAYISETGLKGQTYADGDTLTLLKEVVASFSPSVRMTIDLGGFTLTCKSTSTFPVLTVSGDVVLKNGTVKAGSAASKTVEVYNGSLTVGSDAVIEGGHAIGVSMGSSATLVVNGTVKSTDGYAITGNGAGDSNGTSITVNAGAKVISENTLAIYHPQVGVLNALGGTVSGVTGIEMRAGELHVADGATIVGTAPSFSSAGNENGPTSSGAGIAVAQHTTKHPITVDIAGGDISGCYALHESNPQSNEQTAIDEVKLAIFGGSFKTVGGTDAVFSKDETAFITGGTFNSVVDTAYYDTNALKQNAQDASVEPGKIVPLTFTLAYDLAGGTMPAGASNPESYTYLDEITLVSPERPGYAFAGWTGPGFDLPTTEVTIAQGSTGNRAFKAAWTPSDGTAYTVEFYYQRAGQYPDTASDRVQRTGYTESSAAVTAEDLTPARAGYVYDFAAANIERGTIVGDGSLVLKVHFKQQFAVTFDPGAHAAPGSVPQTTGSLDYGAHMPSAPTYQPAEGYEFAGWNSALPDTVTSDAVFTAKWDRREVVGNAIIVVQIPAETGGATSAALADEAVDVALAQAKDTLQTLRDGGVPAGMDPRAAAEIAAMLDDARDEVTVTVAVKIDNIDESVPADERASIEGTKAGHETVASYFDVGISLVFSIKDADTGSTSERETVLSEIDEPLSFEFRVAPGELASKSVRIAHVHDGEAEIILPDSVDRAAGVVTFSAQRFSTYALLTASNVTVTFDPNGGAFANRNDALQTVAFGQSATRPSDPTLAGYSFAGWYVDRALSDAYDFARPVEAPLTLYAGWTKADDPKGPVVAPVQPENPQKGDGSSRGSQTKTGDANGDAFECLLMLACAAALVLCAISVRRRRTGGR